MSYPAFATHEDILVNYTKANIVKKLKGRYGFKRFKRDGYKCAIEDPKRKYYNVGETKVSKKTLSIVGCLEIRFVKTNSCF